LFVPICSALIPILPASSLAFGTAPKTPILPVIVVGSAIILSALHEI